MKIYRLLTLMIFMFVSTYAWCYKFECHIQTDDLSAYYQNIESLTEQAEELRNKQMNKSVMSNLLNAYATGKDVCNHNDEYQNIEELDSIDSILKSAVADANLSASIYSAIKDDINKYNVKAQNLDDIGLNDYKKNIDTILKGYEDGTLTENNVSEIYMEAIKAQGVGSDMSELIVNPGFETGTTDGWTVASTGIDIGARAQSNSIYGMSSTDESYTPGDYVFNAWNGDGEGSRISQVIIGLQNGTYTLTAWIASHHDNVVFIFGNDSHEGASTTTMEIAVPVKVSFMVEDGTATIGAVGADGTSSVAGGSTGTATEWDGTNGVWYKVDDFHLTFDSSASVDGNLTQLQKTIEIYEPYLSKAMNAEAKAPLEKAINKGKAANTSNTIAEIKDMIAAIEAAVPAAEKSITIYEKVYVYQQKADSLLDADGKAKYYELANQIIDDYNSGVITDGVQELTDAEEYYVLAVKAQTSPGSDMTEAIRNHSFEGRMKYWATKSGEGYVSLGNVIDRNSSWTGCDGMYYAYKQNKISTTQTVQEYQSISGLPAGFYSVKASIKTTSENAELCSNSYRVNLSPDKQDYELHFFLDDNENVEISIKADLTKGQYLQADNFRLTYNRIPVSCSLADGLIFSNTLESLYDKLAYSRTFSNTNWQALYVPFSMSYDDWKDEFEVCKINDVNMYDLNDDGEPDDTEIELFKVKKGTLKPNTPYFIRTKKAGDKTIVVSNATLYPAEENSIDCSSTEMKFTFIGTYSGVSGQDMLDNKYYALAGGALSYATDASASLKPMRWYMSTESRGSMVIENAAKIRLRVIGDDDATQIADIAVKTVDNGNTYTLDGRKVNGSSLKPGMYIKNGKKYLVR